MNNDMPVTDKSSDIIVDTFIGPKTSRQIATLIGKRHDHVLRDIRVLIDQDVLRRRNFAVVSYIDSRNRRQEEYILDHDATLCLILGYNPKIRMAVIRRL